MFLTINNWRSFAFVPEQKCKTQSKRRKRASTIMDVTTSLSKLCLSQNIFFSLFCYELSTGLTDFTDLSSRLMLFQQVNTKMSSSVSAVWMDCTSSLFHTAARGAASIYRMARPVSRLSSTVARRSKSTVRRWKSRASYWPEVRVDMVWVPTHTPCFSPAQNLNWSVSERCMHVTKLVTCPGDTSLSKYHCAPEAPHQWCHWSTPKTALDDIIGFAV